MDGAEKEAGCMGIFEAAKRRAKQGNGIAMLKRLSIGYFLGSLPLDHPTLSFYR